MDIATTLATQRTFFASGKTKDPSFRIAALRKLRASIMDNETHIEDALMADLGKPAFESYLTEIGIVQNELSLAIRKVKAWVKPQRVKTPFVLLAATSRIYPEPFGTVLIMSPWNYPFQLAMVPLIGAIAAGNVAIVKPASYAKATSLIIQKILLECFEPDYVTTILGGREANSMLLDQRFDYIFFTGSVDVGKTVMEKAAKYLTPVTLELGGKSPCILDDGVNLKLAAKRIAFGKFVNAGQTCVAPDYLLIRENQKADFIRYFGEAILAFFGTDPLHSPELPKIINDKHMERLLGLIQGEKAVIGGNYDAQRIAPTLLDGITETSKIMQEEIFGPILPMVSYQTLDEAIAFVCRHEKPLALYLFTDKKAVKERILRELSFGGATFNDTLMHFGSPDLGFGGVGNSGMGRCHGRESFRTFTNFRGVVDRANWIDIPTRYHPYSAKKMKFMKGILK